MNNFDLQKSKITSKEIRELCLKINHISQPSYIRLDKSFNENLRFKCHKITPEKWMLFRNSNSKKAILTTKSTLRFHDRITKMKELKNYSIYSLSISGHKFKNTQTKIS